MIEILSELFERDLSKLKSEIEQYSDAADMWLTAGDTSNSAGNLTLHIVGNLKHYIGAVLGGSGYVRDRDLEFSAADIPREDLMSSIDDTRSLVSDTLSSLSKDDLAKDYPSDVFGEPMTTGFFLIHLATHLNYHMGQINYHRRILSKQLKGEKTPGPL